MKSFPTIGADMKIVILPFCTSMKWVILNVDARLFKACHEWIRINPISVGPCPEEGDIPGAEVLLIKPAMIHPLH